jgi:hypothetical protein
VRAAQAVLSFAYPSLSIGAKPHQQALSKENTLAKKIFVKKIVQNKKKLYICTIKKELSLSVSMILG